MGILEDAIRLSQVSPANHEAFSDNVWLDGETGSQGTHRRTAVNAEDLSGATNDGWEAHSPGEAHAPGAVHFFFFASSYSTIMTK